MPSIAVVGASSDSRKFGNKAVRAYLRRGWTVFPVNPNEPAVEGLATFPSVEAIPEALDRVSLYVPPPVGVTLLEGIARKAPTELWVNPGAGNPALVAKARGLGLRTIEGCSIVDIGERP